MRIASGVAILLTLCVTVVVTSWMAGMWNVGSLSQPVGERSRIVDPAGFIDPSDVPRFDEYLSYIRRESNVDIWIVLDKLPQDATIESVAVGLVEQLRVGGRTGSQNGLLLLFDLSSRRLKVEVGYGLESYFPDAYISFLVERHAPMLLSADDRSRNLRLLLRLLQARIRDASLGGEFDPRPYSEATAASLSGGAGTVNDLSDSSRASLPTSDIKRRFAAGYSPQETYASYLELLGHDRWDPDADLFTQESRTYLRGLALTRGYRDFILLGEFGKSWNLEVRGNLALLYFTGTPFTSPHFFVKEADVWRIDLVAEVRNTTERVGGPLTWSYDGVDDEYTRAFSDLISEVQGYRRITVGDNRPIPTAISRAQR